MISISNISYYYFHNQYIVATDALTRIDLSDSIRVMISKPVKSCSEDKYQSRNAIDCHILKIIGGLVHFELHT